MTTPPPGGGREPGDTGGADDRDTESFPRTPRGDEGPGFSDGAAFSDGPAYSRDAGFADDAGYAGYATSEDRIRGTARVGATHTYVKPEFTEEELEGLSRGGTTAAPRRVLPLEDEPSSLVARYLFPTERYRGEWKRHWVYLVRSLVVISLYVAALCVLAVQRLKPQFTAAATAPVLPGGVALFGTRGGAS